MYKKINLNIVQFSQKLYFFKFLDNSLLFQTAHHIGWNHPFVELFVGQ